MKTFEIDRRHAVLYKWASWGLIAFAVLFIALPFLPDEQATPDPMGTFGLSLVGVIFFGTLGGYGLWTVKRLPHCAVAIDDEGIWPAHLPKATALVRWENIHSTRERMTQQRLDLLGANGRPLLKLEYQLADFEALRAQVSARIRPSPTLTVPATYAKPSIYHAINLASVAGFSLLGGYVGLTSPLLGYGGMGLLVALILHEYFTTVSRIDLLHDRLRLGYPFLTRELLPEKLETVRIGDVFHKGTRHPVVELSIRGARKPIRLNSLGLDALHLQTTLEHWLKTRHIG